MHTAAEMLLFEKATFIYESNRGTDRNLNTINKNWPFPTEQHKWEMLKRAVEKAWPNHPERRLSDTPVTRDNHYYFRKTYLKGMSMLEYLAKEITGLGLEAAEFIGLLNPEAGSISRPDPTQVVPGDGTWTHSAYKNPPPGQPGHDPNHRCDPHAHPLPGQEKGHGYCMVAAVVRGPHRQERIPLFTALLTPGQTDANLFTQKLIQMCKDHPDLTKGLRAGAYDMALRSADSDRLMDHGILPITKTPRTSRGKTAAVNLGPHTFKTATGQAEKDIIALNGTPTIAVMDGEGNPHYQPLRRVRTQIKKPGPRTRKHIVYTLWQIPDKPLVPPHLVGATTRIRNNSTPQERQAKRHTRRTRGLRPVPETDPSFNPLYGPRQDIESHFSTYKRQLNYDRLRTVDKSSFMFNWLAHDLFQINTALVAHHKRTGKDISRWYGNHFPNTRAGPLEKAA